MQDINSQKVEIIKWVSAQDDPTELAKFRELIADIEYDRASDSMVIGSRINGAKVIKSRFVHRIRQAEIGVAHGEFISFQELEQQAENW